MKGILATLAMILTISVAIIALAMAIDYSNHLMESRAMKRITQQYQDRYDKDLMEICKSYREFQKLPEGKDVHAMDSICLEIESKVN